MPAAKWGTPRVDAKELYPGIRHKEPKRGQECNRGLVGRGEVVWETISCPPASNLHDLEAAYDDGFGLNRYEFYCIYKSDIRPSLE